MSNYFLPKFAREELAKKPSSKWFFTLNNYTDEHIHRLIAMGDDWFYVIGKEVGQSGTPHLQGTIWHKRNIPFDLKTMSILIPNSHLERVMYFENAIGYCLKEGQVLTNTVSDMLHFLKELHIYTTCCTCPTWLYEFWEDFRWHEAEGIPQTHTVSEVANFRDVHAFLHNHPPYSSDSFK